VEGKGSLPKLRAKKRSRRAAIVFGDYGRDMTDAVLEARQTYQSVFFRPHPAKEQKSPVMTLRGPLEALWAIGDVAIGHSSTVLVDAEINGLQVISSDPLHVVQGAEDDRQLWLNRLSWAQWSHSELMNGDFWEHLH
jgi:hypothetical protein